MIKFYFLRFMFKIEQIMNKLRIKQNNKQYLNLVGFTIKDLKND